MREQHVTFSAMSSVVDYLYQKYLSEEVEKANQERGSAIVWTYPPPGRSVAGLATGYMLMKKKKPLWKQKVLACEVQPETQ